MYCPLAMPAPCGSSQGAANIDIRINKIESFDTMKEYFGLRGQALNWAVGLIAGCDFLLFGYGMFLWALSNSSPRISKPRTGLLVQTKVYSAAS